MNVPLQFKIKRCRFQRFSNLSGLKVIDCLFRLGKSPHQPPSNSYLKSNTCYCTIIHFYQLLIKVDSRRSVQFCSPRIEVLFKIISAVSAGSMWLHKYHVHMIRMQLQKNFVPVVHCFRNVTNRRKADRGKWVW
jgi:hypothetical protein